MKSKFFHLILTILFLVSCEKDEVVIREFPRLLTLDVSDITSDGAFFSLEFIATGNTPIIDHGFVWSKYENPTLEKGDVVSLGQNIKSNIVTAKIEHALNEGDKYYVRAFAKNEDYITYGDQKSFISLGSKAPVIYSFEPEEGIITDTIKILGKYFSKQRENLNVHFNEIYSSIIACNDTTILVIVPRLKVIENEIKVTLFGNSTQSEKRFKMLLPHIKEFYPPSAKMGDTITLTGEHFLPTSWNQEVFIGDKNALLVSSDGENLKVKIPEISLEIPDPESSIEELLSKKIAIEIIDFQMASDDLFRYLMPTIDSIVPSYAHFGDTISLYGQNLKPTDYAQQVNFDNAEGIVLSNTDNEIKIVIPPMNAPNINELPKNGLLPADVSINASSTIIHAGVDLNYLIPTINKISPSVGYTGDTINIIGKNFMPLNENHQYQIGDQIAKGYFINDTLIKVIVPKFDITLINSPLPLSGDIKKDIIVKFNDLHINFDSLFTLKIPHIQDIQPRNVIPGDTIRIKGDRYNFDEEELTIKLNNNEVEIIKATPELIEFIVPPQNLRKNPLLEIYFDKVVIQYSDLISIKDFVILKTDKTAVTPGDTLRILGENFNSSVEESRLFFQNTQVDIISISSDTIIFEVPRYTELNATNTSIIYQSGELQSNNYQSLQLKKPIITTLNKTKILSNEKIIVNGENLAPFASYKQITYSDLTPTYYSHTEKYLEISLKDINDFAKESYIRYQPIEFTVNGYSINSIENVEYIPNSLWLKLYDFPGPSRWLGNGFSINGKGYIVSGGRDMKYSYENYNDLWEFDPDTYDWTQKSNPPFTARYHPMVIQEGETIIVGLGSDSDFNLLKDIWQYNAAADSWVNLTDYPSVPKKTPFYYLIEGKLYIGGGNSENNTTSDFWVYDINGDQWTEKASIDLWTESNYYSSIASFSYLGVGYSFYRCWLGINNNYYGIAKYDPQLDSWTKLIDWQGIINERATSFLLSGDIYLFDENNSIKLSIPSLEIKDIYMKSVISDGAIGFSVNDKGYYGLGKTVSGESKEIWQFNPELLE